MVPVLKSRNKYKVTLPYTIKDVPYTCVGLRDLSSLLAENKDPYTMYYTTYGISKEEYVNSVLRNDIIVTLITDDAEIINIPSWYFDNTPTPLTVPYINLTIALNVGDLPTSVDVSKLTSELEQFVLDKMGVRPTCALLSRTTEPITESTHRALDFQRRVQMTDAINIYARYRYLQNHANELMDHIKMLEDYISKNPNKP